MKVKTAETRYHHGDLRAAFLDAVAELVRDRGVGQVSLRAAAARVGVTHAAAAHHFGNKAGLLTAFAAQGFALLGGYATEAVEAAHPTDGPSIIAALGCGYIRFAVEHPERFEVMFRLDLLNAADPDYLAASNHAFGLLVSAVNRSAQEGYLRDQDPEVVAVGAWSIAHGLAALWNSGRLRGRITETDSERLADRITKLYVDSVLRTHKPTSKTRIAPS